MVLYSPIHVSENFLLCMCYDLSSLTISIYDVYYSSFIISTCVLISSTKIDAGVCILHISDKFCDRTTAHLFV